MDRKRWCPSSSQDDEAVFMLTEFACFDESYMAALGKHSKTLTWTIEGGGRSTPVQIGLQMEKSLMGKAEILVTEGDRNLFPIGAGQAKASLSEDFVQRWNFCGRPAGLNEVHFYEALLAPPESELDPEDAASAAPPPQASWQPATVTRQLENGTSFEVLVTMADGVEILRSPVNCADLRERHSKKQIHVPWRYIKLEIPKQNPIQAALTGDRGEPVATFFAMPTPAGPDAVSLSTLTVRADRERSSVHVDTSASALGQFVAREAFRGDSEGEWARKAWALQLGAFAEHSVVLEKGRHSGVLRITVDGRRLVEAGAQDLGNEAGPWLCNFRFVGKNTLHFIVFETNRYGMPLDMQGTVTQESHVEHTCSVLVPNIFDMSTAKLQVDGSDFERLPLKPSVQASRAGSHTAHLEALRTDYGINVPYKVNDSQLPREDPIPPPELPPPQPHSQPAKACTGGDVRHNHFVNGKQQAAKPYDEQPTHPGTLGIMQWLNEVKSIWHACSANLRMPSEEDTPENDLVHSHSRESGSAGGARSSDARGQRGGSYPYPRHGQQASNAPAVGHGSYVPPVQQGSYVPPVQQGSYPAPADHGTSQHNQYAASSQHNQYAAAPSQHNQYAAPSSQRNPYAAPSDQTSYVAPGNYAPPADHDSYASSSQQNPYAMPSGHDSYAAAGGYAVPRQSSDQGGYAVPRQPSEQGSSAPYGQWDPRQHDFHGAATHQGTSSSYAPQSQQASHAARRDDGLHPSMAMVHGDAPPPPPPPPRRKAPNVGTGAYTAPAALKSSSGPRTVHFEEASCVEKGRPYGGA